MKNKKISSAKSPDFAVLSKQFPNSFIYYSVGDRMPIGSKSGKFEERIKKKKSQKQNPVSNQNLKN